MSQLSKMTQSRDQWKHKAKQRGEHERYQRKQNARLKAQYKRTTTAFKATQARLRQLQRAVPRAPKRSRCALLLGRLAGESCGSF